MAPLYLPKKPNKLTPEFHERFCQYVREGMPVLSVCGIMKVRVETVKGWLERGRTCEDETDPCRIFFDGVFEAEAACENEAIQQWREINASKKDYRSVQAFLSMRHKWTQPDKQVNVTGQINHVNGPDMSALDNQQLFDLIKKLEMGAAPTDDDIIDITPQEV